MSTTTHSAAVVRALADIEANKTGDPGVDELLDYVGQLIVEHGDPGPVFARVLGLIERERAQETQTVDAA
ncbi:hypothetical protein [Streptomyces sp. SID12501]|uniref:Uncharacterized protein n=1 Tax=Streptomyces sp. SID12501 TaxID=2706042 RepID=A0A6B3C6Y0_9ACTN|nr:hypothetical protein [Streptomyces sp. SID12501]NEC92176.1 hypothetical protein [Streptomyces sp. SID12501]